MFTLVQTKVSCTLYCMLQCPYPPYTRLRKVSVIYHKLLTHILLYRQLEHHAGLSPESIAVDYSQEVYLVHFKYLVTNLYWNKINKDILL